MTQGNAGPSPALVETVAGLTAGSVATLTVHPLDIVKTRMQSECSKPIADTIVISVLSADIAVAVLFLAVEKSTAAPQPTPRD